MAQLTWDNESLDRRALEAAGLADYERLISDASVGEAIAARAGRRIARVTTPAVDGEPERVYYLKCELEPERRRQIASMLKLAMPHASPVGEALMLRAQRRAGLPAARPAAWGERRRGLFAVDGLALIEGVPGRDLRRACVEADSVGRRRLMERFGVLLARCHLAGFFSRTRPQDVIVASEPDPHGSLWAVGDLVLIDRETRAPRPQRISRWRIGNAMTRSWRRAFAPRGPFTARDFAAFYRGYRRKMGERVSFDRNELWRRVESEHDRA